MADADRIQYGYNRAGNRIWRRVTGLLANVAVQLLRMRQIAPQTPDRPAHEVVPVEWVETLAKVRRRPGWITLWRGMEKLLLILRGIEVAKRRCG